MKIKIWVILLVFSGLVFWGCKKETAAEDKEFETEIKEDTTIFLMVDDIYKINITPSDSKVKITKQVDTWYKEPKTEVISLSSDGTIKAIGPGKVLVNIYNNVSHVFFNVIVIQIPKSLKIRTLTQGQFYTDSLRVLKTGACEQLDIYDSTTFITQEEANFMGFNWDITDNSIAAISDSGKLTALKTGETIIQASFKKYPTVKAKFQLVVQNHIVHAVGRYFDEGYYHTVIWKSNQPEYIGNESINSIAFSGNDTYTAGNMGGISCYWKNYGMKLLPKMGDINKSENNYAIAISGNDVYVCGYCWFFSNKTVALWKNDKLVHIINSIDIETDSEGKAIFLAGDDIYVGGYLKNAGNIMVACYWKNSQRVDLSDEKTNASLESIIVEGADVYATGWYENNGVKILCYWKNGIKTDLVYNSANTSSLHISSGNIYACGSFKDGSGNSKACYWLNGTKTSLDDNTAASSFANSIKVIDSNIFVAGYYANDKNETTGCYWINGKRTDLHYSVTNYQNKLLSYFTKADLLAVE